MTFDILTAEEFAARLKIGRSTLFDWISKGVLTSGRHYFKQGRILRFVWSDEVILSLLTASSQVAADQSARPVAKRGRKAAKPGINWDY